MAKKKLKPPPGRKAARRPTANLGWWAGITALVLIGVLLIVASRGERSRDSIVHELEAPTLGNADEVTISTIGFTQFDRVNAGETIFSVEAGDESADVESPVDGFLVGLAFSEGDAVEPGALVATVQTGPDFDSTNVAGHHWHTAYGVYVCNTWLPPIGEFSGNIHSHGDGLFHAHPLSTAEAGSNATVSKFFETAGMSISEDRLRYSDGNTYQSGEVDCDGSPGIMQWALNGEIQEGNPGDLVIGNGDVLAIGFVPEGEEFPTLPPTAGQLPEHGVPAKHPEFQAPETEAPPGDGDTGGDGDVDTGAEGEPEGDTPTTEAGTGEDAG